MSPALLPDSDDNPAQQQQASTHAKTMPLSTTSNNEITRTKKNGVDLFLQLEKTHVKFFASVKVKLPVEHSHKESEEAHALVLQRSMSETPTAENLQTPGKDYHSSSVDEPDVRKKEMKEISDSDKSPTQQKTSADAHTSCLQTCDASSNNITEMDDTEGNLNLEIVVEIADVETQEHESQKAKKYVFPCDQCDEKFNRPYKLREHLDWHKGILYKCELCETVLGSMASLRRHNKSHSLSIPDERKAKIKKKAHECHLCSKVFSIPEKLQEHLEQSHKSGKLYACMICLKALASLQDLKKHAQHCHNSAPDVFEDAEKQQKKLTKPRETYMCDLCGGRFRSLSLLKWHLDFHNQVEAAKCQVCRKVFATRHGLHIHMKIHHVEKQHECEFCQKKFSLSQNLKVHRRIHTGEKPYSCKECSRSFTQKGTYNCHMRIHTGHLFECKDCGKKFSVPRSFKNHQKFHSIERPFVCEWCGLSFVARGSLRAHTKKHAADKNWVPKKVQKPIICHYCGKIFASKKSLMQHLESHPKNCLFHCTDCGESFELESSFKKHKRDESHNRELPVLLYKCKICERKFQQSTELKSHLENEHEIVLPNSPIKAEKTKKSYSCKFCGICFITECKLEVHEICHYPKKVQKMLRKRRKKKE